MPRVAPLVAMRYDTAVVGPLEALTAPPYDVISEPHRARFAEASPYNVVHVDVGATTGHTHPDQRYAAAAATLASWESSGVLRSDTGPSYYAYEVDWPAVEDVHAGRVRGVFVALALEPWGGDVIPHEETMPGPVDDRLRLLRATAMHLSPIYGIVAGPCEPLRALLDRVTEMPALEEVTDEERVRHRVWRVPADAPIGAWLSDEALLMADGHHRYTTALAYRDERRTVDGAGPWDSILALVVDAATQDVRVLSYHRVQLRGVAATHDRPASDLSELCGSVNEEQMRVGIIARDGRGDLTFGTRDLAGAPPAVRALHEELLDELAPGDALRFTHSASDAEEAVREGAVAAYILPPTTPERLREAIERHERLPPKSTFFWPKPRTGLLFMPVR
jgi:uncharacterized protein (DUF1015 family)